MNITVFGATGAIGDRQGHRTPSRARNEQHLVRDETPRCHPLHWTWDAQHPRPEREAHHADAADLIHSRTFLPCAYAELIGMSAEIMNSEPDWTIIRFTAPKDAPRCGRIRVGFFGTRRIGFAVSRADIAAFTAAQARDTTFIKAAPAISN